MQKKKAIFAVIGVMAVIAVIGGGVALHKDSEAVETTAEATMPIVEEDSTKLMVEEPEAEEAKPQMEESVAEEGEAEEPEQDMAEVPEDAAMEEIDAYMYTTADLNMRKEGTTESEVIGSIPYGTKIHVTARTIDNWYRTEREEVGFVSGKYLSEEEPVKQIAQDSTQQTQSTGQGSTPPNGISQEDWNQFREVYRSMTGYYPEDMPPYDPSQETPMPMEGGGGWRLDGTNAWW